MARPLQKHESVEHGLRRIARKRRRHALRALAGGAEAEATHRARKDIKKLRAVVRFVGAVGDRGALKRPKRWLREAAACLAEARDATIRVAALAEAEKHLRPADRRRLRRFETELRHAAAHELKRARRHHHGRAVRRLLGKAGAKVERVRLRLGGWDALQRGMAALYCRSLKAYRAAAHDPTPEMLHTWRKRAKDLGYCLCLLEDRSPAVRALRKQIDSVAEALGADHDLTMLHDVVAAEDPRRLPATVRTRLLAAIVARQDALRRAALADGKRLHAATVREFCRTLHAEGSGAASPRRRGPPPRQRAKA